MAQTVVFGVRHHGPGCARSLVRALQALEPDCILVEGPPDAQGVLQHIVAADIEPPVALLVFCPDDPKLAAFYPFAEFSPEWHALRHGIARGVPTRFIDLPQAVQFALKPGEAAAETSEALRDDPLGWLGRAAGYGDGESWWNHMVEERGDGEDLFAAIREAMIAVRSEAAPLPDASHEALREAHMRKCLREAQKEGFERIAVVCGAWHVPALETLPAAKADNDLLKGLPKVKVDSTWVPWSNGNLASASGYGAGVDSPGWYEHLWRHPERRLCLVTWLAKAARLFREEDIDCSSGHLIEVLRLAETLAALRERPSPGLDELDEAMRTVVCIGEEAPLRLIHRRLVVGERLGRVPLDVPVLPLARDLEQQQKRLRFKAEALQKTLDLDLRQEGDLARSELLHRLLLLGIPWGTIAKVGRSVKGTFHEVWDLQWKPELALAVVHASRWGNTVEDAATARALQEAVEAPSLPALCELVDRVLLADLARAIEPVTRALESLCAIASDTTQLLDAIPPLANVSRYGDVRKTDAGSVARVLEHMIARSAIGLPGACASLDDDAAAAMARRVAGAHQAIKLAGSAAQRDTWMEAVARVAGRRDVHGRVGGLAARMLFDDKRETFDDTARRMSQALSVGADPVAAAAWLEGFLHQSSMVLLHDDRLWTLVDAWVASLTDDYFLRVLPLVRRTFATFSSPERRQLGEKAKHGPGRRAAVEDDAIDWERAARALPTLRLILGVAT